jgi:hypothetical protein
MSCPLKSAANLIAGLRGEPFDEKNVFSTHGIQLNDMPSHSKVSLNQCG